jgi:hypothetical protein
LIEVNLDRPLFSLSEEGLKLEAGAVYTQPLGEATKNGIVIRKNVIDFAYMRFDVSGGLIEKSWNEP